MLSEAKAIAVFVELGWAVLTPFGDNERYDLVIDRGEGFESVQVKTGRLRKGCIEFNAYSTTGRVGNGVERGYRGQADLFAVYYDGHIYLVPVDEVGESKVTLRIEPCPDRSTIRWAKDFLVL